MTDEELIQQIQSRKIVTIGLAVSESGFSRDEVFSLVEARQLKIFDEQEGLWYHENAKGHC